MRNRAKCKLCHNIIESMHSTDLVLCSCGEISVDKGEGLWCAARHWDNFLRVDDDGKEFVIKVEDDNQVNVKHNLTRKEILERIQGSIEAFERLPNEAMMQPASNYDVVSVLSLMHACFKAED